MAIIALKNIASDHPVVPKKSTPKINLAGMNLTSGYGSGGWKYPVAGGGVTATYNPLGTTYTQTTPTPATKTLPVANTLPGGTPAPGAGAANPINYQPSIDEIESSPEYQSALKAYNASQQGNWNNLLMALGGKIAQGGYDVSGRLASALGSDPQWAGLSDALAPAFATAASNPTSDAAQIALQYNRGMQSLPYQQAAMGGIGQSGMSGGYDAGAQGLLEQQQLSTAQGQNSLLSSLYGDLGNYTALGAQGQLGLQQARETAAQRLSMIPGAAYPTGDYTGATPNADVPGTATGLPGTGVPSSAYKPLAQGGPVVWGGKPYNTVAGLKAALAKTGVSYATWRANHPSAAAALERMVQ